MKVIVVTLFLGLCCSSVFGLKLPPLWTEYIKYMTLNFGTRSPPQVLFPSQVFLEESVYTKFLHYLPVLPPILLWHPIVQFQDLFRNGIVCPTCMELTEGTVIKWCCGQDAFSCPRILHDLDTTVLLVGVVYKCDNNHKFFSYDPKILETFPQKSWIPFSLSYKTAFMNTVLRYIKTCINKGMDFSKVMDLLRIQRNLYCDERVSLCNFNETDLADTNFLSLRKFYKEFLLSIPSRYAITCIYLEDFFAGAECKYNRFMKPMTTTGFISLDHTFKVAANIGYFRSDKKWVTQYNSVCIVMNEAGQILTWKFTKGESVDELKPMLYGLKYRINSHGKSIRTACIDNCCQLRPSIQDIFGSNVTVYLDLFHAVQRISRTISKRSKHYHDCLIDLSFSFRCRGDIGRQRSMVTPTPDEMLNNLDSFALKWKDTLAATTTNEINKLKNHVRKGCLSGIPPSLGTNRNEALHRKINPYFKKSRMSMTMAYALLVYLFYCHNLSRSKDDDSELDFIPINPSLNNDHVYTIPEVFGITQSKTHSSFWGLEALDSIESVCSAVENNCASNDCFLEKLSIDDAKSIILSALDYSQLADVFDMLFKKSPVLQKKFLPHFTRVSMPGGINLSIPNAAEDDMFEAHSTRLNAVIHSCGLLKIPILGDGNCCFSAVAQSLKILAKSNNKKILEQLQNLPLNLTDSLEEMAIQLRVGTVKEWIDNSEEYQAFVSNTNVQIEALNFETQGYFNSELGDTMLTALTNFLQMPFIVFTSIECTPILHFTPRQPLIQVPILLAYNQYGAGHYDSLSFTDVSMEPEVTSKIICSCGKGDKNDQAHCTSSLSRYSSRCPCLKSRSACSKECRCRNCNNSFGVKSAVTQTTLHRKRKMHSLALKCKKSIDIALERQEGVNVGPWSTFECFVLNGILKVVGNQPLEVHKAYCEIVYCVTEVFDIKVPIEKKTIASVLGKLMQHQESELSYGRLFNSS